MFSELENSLCIARNLQHCCRVLDEHLLGKWTRPQRLSMAFSLTTVHCCPMTHNRKIYIATLFTVYLQYLELHSTFPSFLPSVRPCFVPCFLPSLPLKWFFCQLCSTCYGCKERTGPASFLTTSPSCHPREFYAVPAVTGLPSLHNSKPATIL